MLIFKLSDCNHMRRIAYLFLLFGFLFCRAVVAQFVLQDSVQLNIQGEITDFSVDEFGNLYFISNHIVLNKLERSNHKMTSYSNHGILENVNSSNPLRISVQSNNDYIQLLDNQLIPTQSPIRVNRQGNFSAVLIKLADNEFVWGYDYILQRLILWDYTNNTVQAQSVLLNSISGDEYFTNIFMQQNSVYLVGYPKTYVFDVFLNLKETISIEEHKSIGLFNNMFIYLKKGDLYKLDPLLKTVNMIENIKKADFFSVNNRQLFVLKNKVVYLYGL